MEWWTILLGPFLTFYLSYKWIYNFFYRFFLTKRIDPFFHGCCTDFPISILWWVLPLCAAFPAAYWGRGTQVIPIIYVGMTAVCTILSLISFNLEMNKNEIKVLNRVNTVNWKDTDELIAIVSLLLVLGQLFSFSAPATDYPEDLPLSEIYNIMLLSFDSFNMSYSMTILQQFHLTIILTLLLVTIYFFGLDKLYEFTNSSELINNGDIRTLRNNWTKATVAPKKPNDQNTNDNNNETDTVEKSQLEMKEMKVNPKKGQAAIEALTNQESHEASNAEGMIQPKSSNISMKFIKLLQLVSSTFFFTIVITLLSTTKCDYNSRLIDPSTELVITDCWTGEHSFWTLISLPTLAGFVFSSFIAAPLWGTHESHAIGFSDSYVLWEKFLKFTLVIFEIYLIDNHNILLSIKVILFSADAFHSFMWLPCAYWPAAYWRGVASIGMIYNCFISMISFNYCDQNDMSGYNWLWGGNAIIFLFTGLFYLIKREKYFKHYDLQDHSSIKQADSEVKSLQNTLKDMKNWYYDERELHSDASYQKAKKDLDEASKHLIAISTSPTVNECFEYPCCMIIWIIILMFGVICIVCFVGSVYPDNFFFGAGLPFCHYEREDTGTNYYYYYSTWYSTW